VFPEQFLGKDYVGLLAVAFHAVSQSHDLSFVQCWLSSAYELLESKFSVTFTWVLYLAIPPECIIVRLSFGLSGMPHIIPSG